MREIVDRHFAGADAYWVVPFYMGFLDELPHAWEPYKAANAALANTTNPAEIKRLYAEHSRQLEAVRKHLAHYLTEGVLTEEFTLSHTAELLHCARAANVTIRWLMLHRRAKLRKLPVSDAEYERREAEQLLLMLMDTAQFEYLLRLNFDALLEKKEAMWTEAKTQVVERLDELSEAFTGEKALSRIGKDEQLHLWFKQLAEQVRPLECSDSNTSGRKMHHLIAALEEVEQFHQIEAALQLKQFLAETRDLLHRMIRVVNFRESSLVTLSVVSDMAYAWLAIADYSPLMRMRIQRNPFSVLKLRATFLKLVSILDAPLTRINQANSPDLSSVSQYYSSEVAAFMKSVLQVIPENMFAILSEVVAINASELRELPVKVVRTELREWSQLAPRHRLARATHRVSVLTEGVLTMQTTLLGVVKVDPKELLEDGIRSELVKQLSHALQSGLTFKQGKTTELEAALMRLHYQLQGFQLALEYIADYVKINGLRLWQEELAGVVNFFVEQERNAFLKRKVHSWQSPFVRAANATNLAPPAAFEHSFFGRLVRELVYLTSPRRSIYSEALGGWTDPSGKEVVGTRLLGLLQRSLGRCGLRGVGSTLGFMVTAQLHRFVRVYLGLVDGELLALLDQLEAALNPLSTLPEKPQKHFERLASSLGSRLMTEVHETVWRCGAAQILRTHVTNVLGGSTRIDCSLLHSILATADAALLTEQREVHAQRAANGGAGSASGGDGFDEPLPPTLLEETTADLSSFLGAAGISQPKEQVMVISRVLPRLPLVLTIFTINALGRMGWSTSLAALTDAKGKLTDESIDGVPLVTGIACILRQYNASATSQYVDHMMQMVRCTLHSTFSASTAKPSEPPSDATTLLQFLELFARHAGVDVPGLHLYQTAVGSMA
jgi:WASH complex subunit strumpellin